MKFLIVAALIGIIAALALAGRAMLKDGRDGQPKSSKMARALASIDSEIARLQNSRASIIRFQSSKGL